MEEELRAAWARDVGGSGAARTELEALLGRYREAHRHYHTVKHLASVLEDVDRLLSSAGGVGTADAVAVRLAAWFHDAIYDPRASGNEAASAALAARVLGPLGVPAVTVEATQRLVLATVAHRPSEPDEAVLCDADLAILAARPAVYDAYVAGVRAEYAHVDDPGWRAGRGAVLQAFLDRPAIFHTATMRPDEHRARANLTAELATLR